MLSNGGIIVYEFDENIGAKRTTVLSTNDEDLSVLEILLYNDRHKYEFDLLDTANRYKAFPIAEKEPYSDFMSDFNVQMDIINGHNVMIYTKKLLSSINIAHYYVKIDSIHMPEFVSLGFSVINKNCIFIYSDIFEEELKNEVLPVEIESYYEFRFSKLVEEKVELIRRE